ncbi:MAG: cell division protein ZapB [Treponema sp.]|nr:cell division protein ZapB [Treponema sp.]
MISLDQVILLEQKIESAVEKIQQLQAENDALRKKCSELTNALSSKSEQLTSFETDQSQIESGILKALDRLNQIENSVLKVAGQAASTPVVNIQQTAEPVNIQQTAEPVKMQAQPAQVTPVHTQPQNQVPAQPQAPVQPQGLNSQFIQTSSQNNFFTMNEVPSQSPDADFSEPEMEAEEENSDNLGFDIF